MDSTFLGQGSYGCVYKQKLRCTKHDSNIPLKTIKDHKGVLSKIYLDKKYATREIEIGKHITKIPNYEHYFSPVLENLADCSGEKSLKVKLLRLICNILVVCGYLNFTTLKSFFFKTSEG